MLPNRRTEEMTNTAIPAFFEVDDNPAYIFLKVKKRGVIALAKTMGGMIGEARSAIYS